MLNRLEPGLLLAQHLFHCFVIVVCFFGSSSRPPFCVGDILLGNVYSTHQVESAIQEEQRRETMMSGEKLLISDFCLLMLRNKEKAQKCSKDQFTVTVEHYGKRKILETMDVIPQQLMNTSKLFQLAKRNHARQLTLGNRLHQLRRKAVIGNNI